MARFQKGSRKIPRNDPANLRNMLDGPDIIRQWARINSHLLSGYKPIYAMPANRPVADLTQDDFKVVGWEPLSREDVTRLTKVIDSYNRLLNKLLPELKAVDVADSRHLADPANQLTAREKATRLYALLRTTPEGKRLLEGLENRPAVQPAPAPAPSPTEVTEPWMH